MDGNIKIAILDDNMLMCEKLKRELSHEERFEVVCVLNDPVDAVRKIVELQPHILLLDLVMPQVDGEEIIEQLRSIKHLEMGIIVISAVNNEKTISRCMKLGAQSFMVKPIDFNVLTKRVFSVYNELLDETYLTPKDATKKPISESRLSPDLFIMSKISNFLLAMGISPKLKGYHFLKDSIMFIFKAGNDLSSVTKVVYPHVACIYETDPERVERSIRNALAKAFSREQGLNYYYSIFEPDVNRIDKEKIYPSNREFMFTIVEYIRSQDYTLELIEGN